MQYIDLLLYYNTINIATGLGLVVLHALYPRSDDQDSSQVKLAYICYICMSHICLHRADIYVMSM